MNIKRISDLNSRWWYRLLKVVYIVLILLCLIGAVMVVYDENSPRKVRDYRVDCVAEYTNKHSFLAEKDYNIYIFVYGSDTVYQSLTEDAKQEIRDICGITPEESKTYYSNMLELIKEKEKLGLNQATIQKMVDDARPYLVSETLITVGGFGYIFLYSILSIVGIVVIFQIIRRIFYYVILGRINPEK